MRSCPTLHNPSLQAQAGSGCHIVLHKAYLLLQIESIFQTIGACLMAIVNGIGAVLQAIIGAIVSLFDIIISCLTCGRGGGRRRRGTSAV